MNLFNLNNSKIRLINALKQGKIIDLAFRFDFIVNVSLLTKSR